MPYTHILFGTDLADDSDPVAEKAKVIANAFGARLSVVHVAEPISFNFGGDLPADFSGLEKEMLDQAKTQLQKCAQKMGIAAEQSYLRHGKADDAMHELAAEIEADLIVVGSHGRHGLALLLGDTASALLHGAHCDVLAVRV